MSEEKEQKQLNLTPDERHNLVGAFAWLIRQDKKQNPERYKTNQNKDYD